MFTEVEKSALAVGLRETKKAVLKGAARVYLAEDAPEEIRAQIEAAAPAELIYVPSMRELGVLCGIDVKASCAAVKQY